MRYSRLRLVLGNKIACMFMAYACLILGIGGAIYNICQESGGQITGIAELSEYLAGEWELILFGVIGFLLFWIAAMRVKKAEQNAKQDNPKTVEEPVTAEELVTEEPSAAEELLTEEPVIEEASAEETMPTAKAETQAAKERNTESQATANQKKTEAKDMKTEIESEQTKIRLEIPEPYELSENEDGDRTFACFERSDNGDMVFSFLLEADEEEFQDAEDYIRREFTDDCAENKCKTKICEHAYLQGRTYCYYIISYKDGHARFQKLVAACDIRPGEIYTVDTDWVDKKEVLTIDAVSPFLDIAVSDKE